MLGRLFLLFTIVPVVELYLLITIGSVLGTVPTLAIVITTGLAGAALAKREGFRVLRSWQEASTKGVMPKDGVISSLLVLVGGVLLVTPGVVTDIVGLTLLIPAARRVVADRLRIGLEKRFEIQSIGGAMPGMLVNLAADRVADQGDGIIDVDARDAES